MESFSNFAQWFKSFLQAMEDQKRLIMRRSHDEDFEWW